MKGDFYRMCGSKKLRREQRDIFLESQNKPIKAVSIKIQTKLPQRVENIA